MRQHRLSQAPDSRSKPQLQLATLPGDPPVAYPLCPAIWDIGVIGTGLIPLGSPCEPVRLMPDKNVRRRTMSSQPQDTLTVIAVLAVIFAILAVAYWRTALRVILIVAIALAVYGAISVIYGLASVMAARHG